jgi:hypothetical protein
MSFAHVIALIVNVPMRHPSLEFSEGLSRSSIKLFLLGVQPSTWKIIDELHQDTKTGVKWKQQTSEIFSSHQGVKQGGLLSAELYKLYSIITLSCGWSLYR